MIFSDRQYQVSKAELNKLQAVLATTQHAKKGEDEWVYQVQIDALRSQIADIEAELAEYDLLKHRKVLFSETSSLAELPRVLIQARIAKGMSQTDLAERMNMKPQQIQRYEATNYMSASLSRLIEVARTLNVKISESFEANESPSGAVFAWHDPDDVSWSRLPIKEMLKRKWFELLPNQSTIDAVRRFFIATAGPEFATALHRKKVRSENVPNEYAFLAWQARVLGVARDLAETKRIKQFELNDTWLNELVRLARQKDGPRKARDVLAERGIVLVIEPHLPGTYLDGAAMLTGAGQPVIGLTLRYDRLDNFWFVLFHELAHIFRHLFTGLRFDFFDEEENSKGDRIEQEADDFALNTLIRPELWDQCLSRFAMTEEAVKIDAAKLGIAESIVAGRIRKERNNYTIFNNLVGQNSVRMQFENG